MPSHQGTVCFHDFECFFLVPNDPRLSSVSCMIFDGFLGQNHVESFLVVQV